MAEQSKAEALAAGWKGTASPSDDDLKGLPSNVAEAVRDVVANSTRIHENVKLAEAVWAESPGHELALNPDEHNQTSMAYRFEEVGGEVVEIRKDSAGSQVKIIHRPDLRPGEKADPASLLAARLQVPPGPDAEPEPEPEE